MQCPTRAAAGGARQGHAAWNPDSMQAYAECLVRMPMGKCEPSVMV